MDGLNILMLICLIIVGVTVAIVNYNIVKRAKERHERTQKTNQSIHKTEEKTNEQN